MIISSVLAQKIIYTCLIFLYIFNVDLFYINSSALVCVVAFLLLIFRCGYFNDEMIGRKDRVIFILLLLLVMYEYLMISVGSTEPIVLPKSLKFLIYFIGGWFVYKIKPNEMRSIEFIYAIINVHIVQMIIVLISFDSSYVNDSLNQYRGSATNIFLESGGLKGFALSTDQAFGIASSFALIIVFCGVHIKNNFIKLLSLIAFSPSFILVGRVVILGYFVYSLFNIKKSIYFALFVFGLFYLSGNLANEFEANKNIKYGAEIFSAIFNDVNDSGSLKDLSEQIFSNNIKLNDLMFGTGNWGNDAQYAAEVDVGYYRMLYFGGLLYLILGIALVFLMSNGNMQVLLLTIILNIKGWVFFSSSPVGFTMIMYYYATRK